MSNKTTGRRLYPSDERGKRIIYEARYSNSHPTRDRDYYIAHHDEIVKRRAAYRKQYRAEYPDKRLRTDEQKEASKQRKREHQRIHAKQRRRENSELYKARAKNWRRDHPKTCLAESQRKRVRKRAATIGYVDLAAILKRDKGICQLCRKPVNKKAKHPAPDSISFDHIIPLALGGSHSQNNIQLAHFVCNCRRGTGALPTQIRFA